MFVEELSLIAKKRICTLMVNRTYIQTIQAILDPQLPADYLEGVLIVSSLLSTSSAT